MTLQRSTPLRRGAPLNRSRIKRKNPRRISRRAEDAPYVAAVTKGDCINCDAPGPSNPAHIKLRRGQSGTAYKVPDSQCVALCTPCHMFWDGQWDGPENPFVGLSELERFAIGQRWVAATRAKWAAHTGAA